MRKVTLTLLFAFSFLFFLTNKIYAGCACAYVCTARQVCNLQIPPICGWATTCSCPSQCVYGAGGRISCDPGYYACNFSGVGGGVGSVPSCCAIGSGGGGGSCTRQCSRGCTGGTQGVECGRNGSIIKYWCEQCGSSCTPSCGTDVCGNDGCGGSCGTCPTGDMCVNDSTCCTPVDPDSPIIISPPDMTQVRVGSAVSLEWSHSGNWGNACTTPINSFNICVSSDQVDCDLINTSNGLSTSYNWTPSTSDPLVTWFPTASNDGVSSSNGVGRDLCVEGYNIANTAYVSNWSTCNTLTHKRTRTCTEDCGTDDCTGVPLEEDCMGAVRGTLFDASDLSSCPAFDPATGYLIGVDTTLTANSRTFGFADAVTSGGTHPWAPLSTVQTSSTGNYNLSVYAPTTYNYDFSSLSDIFVVSSGPKLTCTSASAVVPDNSGTCGTQPCSVVNNMSFGFNRFWGGWWQVVGASVHGENGVKSSIPNSLATEQSLILPDASTGNRRGVLSYGTLITEMLGVNAAAKVSNSLWQVDSNYEGVIYDYAYFNQLLKKYSSTTWNGSSALIYDDGGKGYEIVKVAGPVANFNYNPTGTEKIIFLIDGSVTVNANLVTPVGAYMAVIASGDISFATNVTRADGWFLADNIYVRCIDADADLACDKTDSQFLGNGSFVGWKGIYLGRDRGGATNITGPAEKFTYRLDLHTNAPEQMKNVTKTYKPYVP